MKQRLWWASRPLVWFWRLGYLDVDASRVALCFAILGRAPAAARDAEGAKP